MDTIFTVLIGVAAFSCVDSSNDGFFLCELDRGCSGGSSLATLKAEVKNLLSI